MVTAAMKLKDVCSLEEKTMTKLDSILKSTDITLPTKVHLVKAVTCPVLMYVYESWDYKENEDHDIWSHHFMGNRWGNSGNSVRLYFWGSKITANGDCSHEIKRRLLLGRKVMTNLESILKSRDITLSTKVHLVKAMAFSSGHVWI